MPHSTSKSRYLSSPCWPNGFESIRLIIGRSKADGGPDQLLLLPRAWHHRPKRRLRQGELMRSIKRRCPGVHCPYSQEASPQPQRRISKDAIENLIARTAVGAPSRMSDYELQVHCHR